MFINSNVENKEINHNKKLPDTYQQYKNIPSSSEEDENDVLQETEEGHLQRDAKEEARDSEYGDISLEEAVSFPEKWTQESSASKDIKF